LLRAALQVAVTFMTSVGKLPGFFPFGRFVEYRNQWCLRRLAHCREFRDALFHAVSLGSVRKRVGLLQAEV
jgi:hypothetical protein